MYSGRFAAMTDEGLKQQLETKLFGFMRVIRLVHPMMSAQQWGRIVNMIGGAGKEPDPYMFGSGITNSGAAQHHQVAVDRVRRRQRARERGVPGLGRHQPVAAQRARGLQQELGVQTEEEARRLAARKNSLNRFGKPEELANAIVFLCSERASYITGVSLNLDGGRLKGLW